MRTCASVFSWIGGIATSALEFIWILPLCEYDHGFGWFLFILTLWNLFVLIWRQVAVENGSKIPSGVCTLIFVSLVGGILTLCIPESQLGE